MAGWKTLPFEEKFVMIAGGSKGIGKETAKVIAGAGGSLCLIARDPAVLNQAAAEVEACFTLPGQFV